MIGWVTRCIRLDHFGGDIVKTWVTKPDLELWHFYNRIDGKPMDFTISQFDDPIEYQDVPASRVQALADCHDGQYEALRTRVAAQLAAR